MMLFGVTLAKRYTISDKNLFYKNILKMFEGFGFKTYLQERKTKLQTVSNIVAGDLNKAKIIIAAAYDTPTKVLFPKYKYYPFHTSKNIRSERLNLVIRILIATGFAALTYFVGKQVVLTQGFLKVLFIVLTAFIAFGGLLIVRPTANRFNFSRNSASLAVMASVAANIKDKNKVAFVFLDKSVESFEGMKLLYEENVYDKTVIVLDSLADGKMLLAAFRREGNNEAEKIEKEMKNGSIDINLREYNEEKAKNNVLNFGKKIIYLVSGLIEDKDFVVKNTRSKRDIKLDMKRLEGIKDALCRYIEKE